MSRSSRGDSNSPSCCSTLALSQTNTVSTYTSPGSCDCDEEEMQRLQSVICVKLALVIITLLGGAILGLTINLWGQQNQNDSLDDNDVDFSNPLRHFSKNLGLGLCLQVNENGGLVLAKCSSGGNEMQKPFIYNMSSTKIKKNDDCLEAKNSSLKVGQTQSVYAINLKPCIDDSTKDSYKLQSWRFWKKCTRICNMYNKAENKCIMGIGEDIPVNMSKCSEVDPNQRWKLPSLNNMIELLYSRSYVSEYVFLDSPEEL